MATVIQWLIDTRPLFPSAKQTSDLPQAAPRAMSLLAPSEAAAVLRYHFLADAKLALLSALLKRLLIAQTLHVPWHRATPVRDAHSKPVFYLDEPRSAPPPSPGSPAPPPPRRREPLLFNVSHQAGVVVLLAALRPASPAPAPALGIDIVCPAERRARDVRSIRADGWARFVGMHEDVFAAAEAQRLRGLAARAGGDEDERLECFYALWCLREAWVKMTGEALLAPWLGELEMRNWAPPGSAGCGSRTDPGAKPGARGEAQTGTRTGTENHGRDPDEAGAGLEVWFRGARVDDASVRLERWGAYMIATAVRGEGIALGAFEELAWEDVLARAEALRG